MNHSKRKSRCVILAIFVLAITCVAVYLSKFPFGANPFPFLARAPEIDSLFSGGIEYQVYYNDAGAAHSGNHWCWIVHDGLIVDRVVKSGYVEFDSDQRRPLLKTRVQDGIVQVYFLSDDRSLDGRWQPF